MRVITLILSLVPMAALAKTPTPHHKDFPSHEYSKTAFTSKKAIVVIELDPPSYDISLVKFANDDGSEFPMLDSDNNFNLAYRIDNNYFSVQKPAVFLIDPGYYAFNTIDNSYYSATSLSNKKKYNGIFTKSNYFEIPYGGFYAPAGKVTNIGKIKISIVKQDPGFGFQITQSSNFKYAKQYLEEHYPELAEQLTKARYYNQGASFQYK